MIQYKCKGCGGQLDIGDAGSLVCPYCGSKSFMADADFKGNEVFRRKMLSYVKARAQQKEFDYSDDNLWEAADSVCFEMADSQPLYINYMFKYSYNHCDCFVAKETVVYVFDTGSEAALFLDGIRKIEFPEADNKLSRCFPVLKMELELKGGAKALVFVRRPGFYPAELFAPWPSEHLAWVISRMENFCCTFEYSEIQFEDITPASVFINPVTHEGALFGDWRNVKGKRNNKDLEDLRKAAIELAQNTREPKELYSFLNSGPGKTAFEDFEKWDKVIEEGFGGHKFVKM